MMAPPKTLSAYLARRFVANFLMLLGALLAVIYLFEIIELLRRASGREVGFLTLLQMSVLKLPQSGQQLIPFAVLFAGIQTFWRMTRSQELVITRSVGTSAWQFLIPVLLAAALIGLLRVGVVNPISTVFIAKFESLESRYLEPESAAVELLETGLWLRQDYRGQRTILHAEQVRPESWALQDVTVLYFDGDDRLMQMIETQGARLEDKAWHIDPGRAIDPNGGETISDGFILPTNLTRDKMESSFASPDAISVWQLPGFIDTMEATGFSAIRLRVHFQSLLAQPLLYASLILIAASVGLRPLRQGKAFILVIAGVGIAFAVFFLSDVAEALGLSGTLPPAMAAWIPAVAATLFGVAALLHFEDG